MNDNLKEVTDDMKNDLISETDLKNEVEKKDFGDVIEDAKEVADKALEVVGEAAKIAGDFAEQNVKQAKEVFNRVINNFGDEKSKRNLEKYRPIFVNSMEEGIRYPKMINVVDYDKRMDVAECEGAVGFMENIKNVEVLGIYQKDFKEFKNVKFYPNTTPNSSVYYVHPIDNNLYIEITEYFKYLKEQRIAELEYIAQELGAKHFKVQIMEETMNSSSSKNKVDAKLGFLKNKAGVNLEKDNSQSDYEYIGIAAENTYPGKEPEEPVLKLWANNESIKSLVKQRMSKDNQLQSKKFRLDYNTSSGIKESEAAKIDGVLKSIKFGAAGKITEEAKKESKRKLEYSIEF